MNGLATIDATSAVEVTDYLTKARDWLSTAVEKSTPLGISGAKVEIAVAAEATKQLGLSKEIQDEAAEMVRRAEYTLRKATKKAQDSGEVRSRQTNLVPGNRSGSRLDPSSSTGLPSPKDFFANETEYEDANAMGALAPDEFEAVLAEAKAEGNLSRANVARKAREKSGRPDPDPTPASDDASLALLNDIRGPWTRGITKSARLMSPKARAHLIDALENTLTQIRNIR